jgi:hypothetical protein
MSGTAAGTLFNRKTLKNALRGFSFPADLDERHQTIQNWIEALRSGRLAKTSEVSLHGDFLNDIFKTVLGYRSIVGSDPVETVRRKKYRQWRRFCGWGDRVFQASTDKQNGVKLEG